MADRANDRIIGARERRRFITSASRISVVIPSYNQAHFLLDSVSSVFAQTMTDLECIVVDDGSTDDSLRVLDEIADSRLVVIQRSNGGTVSATRNAGIAAATGSHVAFLDADDWWFPRKLEQQVRLLEHGPDLGFVYCGYAITATDLRVITAIWPDPELTDLRDLVLTEGFGLLFASSAVVRSDVLDDVGGFNVDLSTGADIDLAERITQRYRFAAVPECLAAYRTHGGQMHRELDRYEQDLHWLLEDRFGVAGSIDRPMWVRGHANLYTRLAIYEAAKRHPVRAAGHLRRALRLQPSRVAGLPSEAVARRMRRWLRIRRVRRALNTTIARERTQALEMVTRMWPAPR